MELTLRVSGEDSVSESRALLARLRAADELPGLTAHLDRGPVGPGELGTLDEVLRLVFDPQLTAAVAGAVATWLTTRRRAVEVHLKQGDRELKLSAGSPRDARKMVAEIESLLDEQAE